MVDGGLCSLLGKLLEEGDVEEVLFLLLGDVKPGGGRAGGGGLIPERLELPVADDCECFPCEVEGPGGCAGGERFSVKDPGGGPSGGRGREAMRLDSSALVFLVLGGGSGGGAGGRGERCVFGGRRLSWSSTR